MLQIVLLGAAAVAVLLAHVKARQYVRGRLRFVDSALQPWAPWVAGAGAAALAAVAVSVIPVLGAGTAIAFGIGVGSGVHWGARDVKRLSSG